MSHIVERYWDDTAGSSPWYSWGGTGMRYAAAPTDAISQQSLADALALERRYLADIVAVPRANLDADSKLTYDIFLRERELAIESFTYPSELLPVNPYDSVPQQFALMASAAETRALLSARELESWRTQAHAFAGWVNQAIANMRDGMRRGYTLPRSLVEKTLPLMASLGEDAQRNVFYAAARSSPAIATDEEHARLSLALAAEIRNEILPSYRNLRDFLQHEYLPRSRDSVGLSALPLGGPWYAYLVRRATSSTLTPEQLNELASKAVERARGRIQALLTEASFAGTAQDYLETMRRDPRFSYSSSEDLLNAFRALKPQVAASLPALFSSAPRADFEIRAVEEFRATTAPASSYRGSMAYGKIPAVLYVDTAGLDASPATGVASEYLLEAEPGHHYQLALQQERADLPRFRRFGGAPAYLEGWGLYAASLGEELGIYRDPETRFGALLAQLECAARGVADTGLHSRHWSRQQAVDYLRAQLPIDDAAIANLVDRDMALPAEAVACSLGFVKIQLLRAKAQQTLGPRFDLRAFHDELLKNGAVPLDLLEARVQQWIETVAATPAASD